MQEYTLIPGVIRADTGNGESTLLEGTWSFTEKENLEVIPELGKRLICDLVFTPKDGNYPYYVVKGVEVHVEKKTPQQTAIHESASYIYTKGSDDVYVDLQAKLPADKKGDSYSCSVTGDEQIFDDYEITRNGQLNYKVKDFTDRSMIGKTGTIHVRVTMKNYKDVSYDLTVTLTDQKKVVLKAGSEIKVLQDRKLTYGETLSNLQLNLEGKEKAVFVEQGTDTQIPGTLAWKDGTQRPDTSVTSAEWIFTPDDVAYAKAEGSTAITVEAKKLEITAATADDKVYDGTAYVSFRDIVLDGVEAGDEVSVDIGTVRGTLRDVKAGDYTYAMLPELKLTGKDKENYILVQPTGEVPLTKAVNVAKSSGLQVEEQNKSYLYLKDQEERISLREILPVDCGNAQYAAPEMTGNMEYITEPSIANDILSYTVKQGALDRKGKIQIKVTTENYEDFVITFNLECNDRIPVRLQEGTEVTLKKDTLTYGNLLSALEFSEAEFVDGEGNTVEGTLAWKDATQRPDTSMTSAEWIFTPDHVAYANVEGSTAIKVNPKELTVTKATARNRKYDGTNQVAITEVLLSGMLEGDEVSVDLTDLHGTLKDKKAGEYTSVTLPELTLAGKDKANYRLVQLVTEIPLTKAVTIETQETTETPETPQKPSDPGTKPGTSEPIQKPEYLKKGTKFTGPDKNQYKVTCADGKTFTVAFLKPKKGTKGTVKIPGSVTVNQVTYKVTAIAANAFKNQKKIKKVVIPSSVNRIGKKAFYGCKNLKNITIKTIKLTKKKVGSKAFSGIHAKAVIKVPKKKQSAYKKILKARGVTKKEKVQAIKVKFKKA